MDFVLTGHAFPAARRSLRLGEESSAPTGAPQTVIDVMVLYTGLAKAAYGETALREKIALSIAYMNEACNRSGVYARFRLVYQAETTWHQESSDAANELYWLSTDETVADLRENVGADLVSLLVRDGKPNGGMAQLPGIFSIFNGNPFVFTHECGHNLGCAHDRPNAGYSANSTKAAFGYSFTPPGTKAVYGDIMSYVGSQIQQFSNPAKIFLKAATGLPEGHVDRFGAPDSADNVSALNLSVPYVAAGQVNQATSLGFPELDQGQGQFSFWVSGPAVGACAIEWSSDGAHWQTLTNLTLTGDNAQVLDSTIGTSACRFYRPRSSESYVLGQLGYIRKVVPPGLSMIANQLETLDNSVGALLSSVPDGTQLYKWEEGAQSWQCNTFDLGSWDNPAMTLHPGEGAVIRNRRPEPITLCFVGEVNQALNNRVPLQLSIRSSAVPDAGALSSQLGYVPAFGEGQIIRMTGRNGSYTVYTCENGEWSPEEPVVELGEAFWCRNGLNALIWQRVGPLAP